MSDNNKILLSPVDLMFEMSEESGVGKYVTFICDNVELSIMVDDFCAFVEMINQTHNSWIGKGDEMKMLKFDDLHPDFKKRLLLDYELSGVKLTDFYNFIDNVSFFEYPRLLKFFDYPRPLGDDDGISLVAVHGVYNDGENEYLFFEGVKDRVNGNFGLINKVDF